MSRSDPLKPKDVVSVNIKNSKRGDEEYLVIIISKNIFHASNKMFVGLTVINDSKELPYTIRINPSDLESCQLPDTSRVKYDRIITVFQSNILEKKGNVSSGFFSQIMEKIKNDVLEI